MPVTATARALASIVALALAASPAAQGEHPSPPRRPELPSANPAETKPLPSEPPKSAGAGEACYAMLKEAGAVFEPSSPPPGASLEACVVEAPVRLSAIAMEKGSVEFGAKPLLACAFALRFTDFVRRLAGPLGAATMNAPLVAIESGPGYECRSRNRVASGKISAHGKGVAIDVSAFLFAQGRRVAVEGQPDSQSQAYLKTLRTAACGWFTTVLGPGADAAHASHLHLDIERHGASDAYRICQ